MFPSNIEDSYIDDYEYNEVVDDAFDLLGPKNNPMVKIFIGKYNNFIRN